MSQMLELLQSLQASGLLICYILLLYMPLPVLFRVFRQLPSFSVCSRPPLRPQPQGPPQTRQVPLSPQPPPLQLLHQPATLLQPMPPSSPPPPLLPPVPLGLLSCRPLPP